MTHVAWVVALLAVWACIIAQMPTAAIIAGVFLGALFTRAAYQNEIKRLRDDRDAAYRHYYSYEDKDKN